jgi:hypothetical protein
VRRSRLDPRRLVFIDEAWAKTNMTRRHGALQPRHPPGREGATEPLAHANPNFAHVLTEASEKTLYSPV